MAGPSNPRTAKVHLASWTARRVFRPAADAPGKPGECHGDLVVSMAAGHDARGNPRIGEAGRQFLLAQLERLTDAHLHAIFSAARIERLPEPHAWTDPRTGRTHAGTAAWVAAFGDKVREIAQRPCAP